MENWFFWVFWDLFLLVFGGFCEFWFPKKPGFCRARLRLELAPKFGIFGVYFGVVLVVRGRFVLLELRFLFWCSGLFISVVFKMYFGVNFKIFLVFIFIYFGGFLKFILVLVLIYFGVYFYLFWPLFLFIFGGF